MARLRPYPVTAFCAVTLFIWTNRIWLAWTNDTDTLVRKLVWSVPITAFVVAAVVIAGVMLAGRVERTGWFVPLVRAFAAGTVLFWAIRAPMIALADHDVAFVVVHTVLAVASVSTAIGAWRAVGRLGSTAAAEREPAPVS
ncbi:MAG: hypothetical protein KDA97_06530 [Acidimicrobiales bacterium]|nr:hypothetical protein [Acidimicrobiales bacterium]